MNELSALRYIMPMIVSICEHCDEQQFQSLSCVLFTIFSLVKLDLYIRAPLLDDILSRKKNIYIVEQCIHLSGVEFSSL